MKSIPIAMLLLFSTAAAAAPPATHPVKVTGSEASKMLVTDPRSQIVRYGNGPPARWIEMLGTADAKFSAGTYKSEAVRAEISSYARNEFMYFIEGGVTLTSADGTVTEVKAGDGVTLPKGWTGVWDTKGYTKFYVTYDPDAAAKAAETKQ